MFKKINKSFGFFSPLKLSQTLILMFIFCSLNSFFAVFSLRLMKDGIGESVVNDIRRG